MFPLIQAFYWLSLATWFGAAVFAAVVPPIILRVVRQHDPTLPRVLSVNLEGQHATLLTGSVVAEILQVVFRIEAACAVVLLLTMIGQWAFIDRDGVNLVQPVLRTALFVAGAVFMIYNWRFTLPRVIVHRDRYIANADDPDIANPALDQFDRQSATSLLLLQVLVFVLTGLVLFSSMIQSASTTLVRAGS